MDQSIAFLRGLGVWDVLSAKSAALKTMQIIDGTGRLFRAPTVPFRASEIGLDAFGYNFPNSAALEVLSSVVSREQNIRQIDGRIAEATFDAGITPAHDDAATLHAAMVKVMRAAPREKLKALLLGHPDLAGKLAAAGEMTEESIGEQASAGLDRLTSGERARFTEANEAYKARFGIPFIMAVAGASKDAILASFETRLQSTPEVEFETALGQVERISLLRLKEIMR